MHHESHELLEQSPPEHLRHLVKSLGGDVCVLPDVAVEALRIAEDPEGSIVEFARLVERDVTLAAAILRGANSALFGLAMDVTSLHRAVHILGFRRCRNLVVAACVTSMNQRLKLEARQVREVLWRHSYVTAMAAIQLNRFLGFGFQGEEFTAGLLHDIGRSLLAMALPDAFSEVDALCFEEDPELLARERQVFGCDHTEFGCWFLADNGLPDAMQSVVRHHHAPHQSPNNHDLVGLICAADHMANHLHRYGHARDYKAESNEGIRFLESRGHAGCMQQFCDAAETLLEVAYRNANSELS